MTTKTITETEQNSITLKKNSKGQYDWEIKVYFDNDENIVDRIDALNAQLKQKYQQEG